MSVADREDGGADGLSPINLIDRSLEDLVSARLREQPVAMPEGALPFVLESGDAQRILAYQARRRDLWPWAKQVQSREIEEVLKALEEDPPVKKATGTADSTVNRFWTLRRIEARGFGGLHRHSALNGEDAATGAVEEPLERRKAHIRIDPPQPLRARRNRPRPQRIAATIAIREPQHAGLRMRHQPLRLFRLPRRSPAPGKRRAGAGFHPHRKPQLRNARAASQSARQV